MNNGLGPWWFSPIARANLTMRAKTLFPSKPWEEHDMDYWTGGTPRDRRHTDRVFLEALLSDAETPSAYLVAFLFYGLVSIFGGFSFNYIKT
jgi:hypothetical protein